MDTFVQTFGAVFALALGIMVISLFFWGLGRLTKRLDGKKIAAIPGLTHGQHLVDVHLVDGSILGKMKVLGLAQRLPNQLPHHISQMLVLEDPEGLKIYLKSDTVKMLKEIPTT